MFSAHFGRFSCPAAIVGLLLAVGVAHANPALEGYRNYQQMSDELQTLASSPAVEFRSLGETLGGRQIHLLTVGEATESGKPAILIIGNVHGPHLVGSEIALRLAQLLSQHERPEVQTLLEQVDFHIVPLPSPDASEKCFEAPFHERPGNARPTDDDRDFQIGEDPAEDLNGDGWITTMRVSDDGGGYMAHPDDPRVLIPAEAGKGEQGRYRVYVEGLDRDGDGQFSEDGSHGVSFNRNFTFRYSHFGKGAGPHAVSEVETRAIADFAFDHPSIAAVFTFTPEDNLMHVWPREHAEGVRGVEAEIVKADEPYYQQLAERYRQIHGGTDAPRAPAGEGSFSEWAYFHYGRWSLAARAWWIPAVPLPEGQELQDSRGADELNALRWFDQQDRAGFVPWTPVDHPDFPVKMVEVGGFKPFYDLNPPAAELDPLAEKHFAFLQHLVESLPRLEIAETEVQSLGAGVFRLSVTVINRGFLPTMSQMGRITRRAYPLRFDLNVDQPVEWIQGHPRGQLEVLAGSGGTTEVSWLLRITDEAPATAELELGAPAVGWQQIALPLR